MARKAFSLNLERHHLRMKTSVRRIGRITEGRNLMVDKVVFLLEILDAL